MGQIFHCRLCKKVVLDGEPWEFDKPPPEFNSIRQHRRLEHRQMLRKRYPKQSVEPRVHSACVKSELSDFTYAEQR
jgi:hypothetical protein